jgi:hypothetical protein
VKTNSANEQLISVKDLTDLRANVKAECDTIAKEAQSKIEKRMQDSQALLKVATEKFTDAKDTIMKDIADRAAKIQVQMEALAVATSHGRYNGKVSMAPVGKCCCVGASDEEPKCSWHNQAALQGRLSKVQCPSEAPFEYTDLAIGSYGNESKSAGGFHPSRSDFVDASRIESLLGECVQSKTWQERLTGAERLGNHSPEKELSNVNIDIQNIEADQVKLNGIFEQLMAPITGSTDEENFTLPGGLHGAAEEWRPSRLQDSKRDSPYGISTAKLKGDNDQLQNVSGSSHSITIKVTVGHSPTKPTSELQAAATLTPHAAVLRPARAHSN